VPTFTHVRYVSVLEPQSNFEAIGELISLAATTGTHMHLCHLNSTSERDIVACAELVRGAQARGLRVTTEAYPYGASSTAIGAEAFRGPDWMARRGVSSPSSLELNGQRLTQAKIDELQKSAPGTIIVFHFLEPEQTPSDQTLLDVSLLYPGSAIASDAMPWLDAKGNLVEGDVWPLPSDVFAHPRSAGCFCRFVRQYVRERNKLTLVEAMRKTSLIPAQILGESVPQMRGKGRLQVGMDADIVVFDLDRISDRATYTQPAQTSAGVHHLIVNGGFAIRDQQLFRSALHGRPVRRPLQA